MKHVKTSTLASAIEQAYVQGISAWSAGLFLKGNPYGDGNGHAKRVTSVDPFGHLFTAWNDGWLGKRDVREVIERSLDEYKRKPMTKAERLAA